MMSKAFFREQARDSRMKHNHDIIVIGAGLVGLATAYNLLLKNSSSRILILEKEQRVAVHQSGNNSGVIHSGIYYRPGSLKATNCLEGYHSIINFAQEHGVDYEICGKIIVATSQKELGVLDQIYERGLANGLRDLKFLSREEFREVEPHCEGIKAIRVPQTGIIDYKGIAEKLKELVKALGGEILFGQHVQKIQKGKTIIVETQLDEFETDQLITCAGLYSDRLGKLTNDRNDLIIVPFRGEYFKLKEESKHLVKNLIYPVPNPEFPFLGVHFTRMINGDIEAGPNAVLALRREGYKFSDFNLRDALETVAWPGFHKIVRKYGKTGIGEVQRSLSKSAFTRALQKLIPEITESDLIPGGAGVRAQALTRSGILVDDFDILNDGNIIHVRNAPSPAATSCLAIGKTVSQII